MQEFINYINENGLPEFISFDHDLGAGLPKGLDCARWLISYCEKNNLKIPQFFVHSANPNGQREINGILNKQPMFENRVITITENDIKEMVKSVLNHLNEDVYIDNINNKRKTANITYQKGNSNYKKKVSNDYLGTSMMEQLGPNTFPVKLKNNLISYNITDINGTEVMHYFKNKFDRKSTDITIKDKETGEKENYKLKMENDEFNQFLNIFFQKVNKIIEYKIKEFGNVEFEKVSIYPVPSSSNFNVKMAEEMTKYKFANIKGGTQIIDTAMFKKDLKNIAVDTDFINKNKKYYDSPLYSDVPNGETHINSVNTTLNKFKQMSQYIDKYVEYINTLVDRIMTMVYQDRINAKKKGKEYTDTLG